MCSMVDVDVFPCAPMCYFFVCIADADLNVGPCISISNIYSAVWHNFTFCSKFQREIC